MMVRDFPNGAAALSMAFSAKTISSHEAVTHYLAMIERDNPHWTDLYPALPGVKPVADDWNPRNPGSSGQAEDDNGRGGARKQVAPVVPLAVPSLPSKEYNLLNYNQ